MKRHVLLSLSMLLALLAIMSAPATAQTYTFTDLGTLSGGNTMATCINDSGQIAGSSSYSDGNPRAFRVTPTTINGQQVWYRDQNGDGKNDLMTLLGLPKGSYRWSSGRAINASGQVTGTAAGSGFSLPESAVVWSASGAATALTAGTSSSKSEGFGIDDAGSVCGVIYPGRNGGALKGTLWRKVNGSYTSVNLGTVAPYTGSIGWSINNAGQIAGSLYTSDGSVGDAFLWSSSAGIQRVPGFSAVGNSGSPNINGSGIIVGNVGDHVTLWVPSGAGAALGLSDGLNDIHDSVLSKSIAMSINTPATGQPLRVVGWATDITGTGFAFVWDSATRQMRNLTEPAVTINFPAGWVKTTARGINAAGQIVGSGTYQGVTRAFVLNSN